eukprot:CAMPEP_0115427784 /NCGR_PEP_ID=MMETSP0271-20121206/29635_1 /TAXON_ID=71861 /ORGANISM="Scrippsiella trochoidea, Strain CCMP3099" /LENGTH=70 /DNA_ID=CAMNT_0002852847 /DNA_START=251 /DNA_END=466 /DNA_ORIENTATION=-
MIVTDNQWTQYFEVVEATVTKINKRMRTKKPPRFIPNILKTRPLVAAGVEMAASRPNVVAPERSAFNALG